jgi:hypothetical protein
MSLPLSRRLPMAAALFTGIVCGVLASSAEAQPNAMSLNGIFLPDTADVTPTGEAALKLSVDAAQPPQQCPSKATFKIMLPAGKDPLLADAIFAARRDVLQAVLRSHQLQGPEWVLDPERGTGPEDVLVSYGPMPDKEPPNLTTTSTPRKGTKVQAGDKIEITIVARDDGNAWQTGIKSIQLTADDGLVQPTLDNGLVSKCQATFRTQTLKVNYTVPSNPPPIVHLKAIAEDFVGNADFDIGEFPTGEMWKGTVKLERDEPNPQCSAIKSETVFSIVVAGDGQVSGSGTLDHSSYTCPPITMPATHATVSIGGAMQDGTFRIYLTDWDPKNAPMPRLPGGLWIVNVGQGAIGEGTFNMRNFGATGDIIFRVKLECVTCSNP